MTRREFLQSAVVAGATSAESVVASDSGATVRSPTPAFELDEFTIAHLQKAMETGQYTSRQLVEKYSERIDALDRRGPSLRHVLEINPDAGAIADERDAERKAGKSLGPLHGVPILLKDNLDTADRMTTTAGSLALEGSIAPRDSFVARKVRQAGAVLLGKANLSEWANFRSTHSSSGWSGRGGQGKNPYALDRTPSGSSSGSAGAVASNFCAAAVGTETDGSIVSPSSCCSVVGIKPTVGLVSRSGIIPISHTQDTAGPIARTVEDAATLLTAIAGSDPDDDATAASDEHRERDYTRFLDKDGLKGARLGILRDGSLGLGPPSEKVLAASIEAMKSQGAVVIDPVEIPDLGKLGDPELNVLLYEFKAGLNAYLSRLGPKSPVRSLEELIAFNEHHRDPEMPFFGQELFETAQKKAGLDAADYREALDKCRQISRHNGLDAAMEKHKLDALVAITSGPPILIDLVNGDYSTGGSSTLAAVAGYPAITVPAGYAFGLPIGISFFGRAWSEPTLIKLAYAFEQATKVRRPPTFAATAELHE
ncbi:MAG: N-carbamoylputrescine amidase [Phycisphaerales bacterium]|nr:N-carbamoylputrescine amidase [Phycisphaerales bacterium]